MPLNPLTTTWPLLLGMAILMLGAGLQGTLLGLRATIEGFPTPVGQHGPENAGPGFRGHRGKLIQHHEIEPQRLGTRDFCQQRLTRLPAQRP